MVEKSIRDATAHLVMRIRDSMSATMPCSTPMTLIRDLSYRLKLKIESVSTTCSTRRRSEIGFEAFGDSLLYPKHAAIASIPWCCGNAVYITAVRLRISSVRAWHTHKWIESTHLIQLPLAVERRRDDLKCLDDFDLSINL